MSFIESDWIRSNEPGTIDIFLAYMPTHGVQWLVGRVKAVAYFNDGWEVYKLGNVSRVTSIDILIDGK